MSWLFRMLAPLSIPRLARLLAAGQGILLVGALLQLVDLEACLFVPRLFVEGEWWRLLTFVFVPPPVASEWGLLFAVMGIYLIFLYGDALEQMWGTVPFNVFVYVGFALTLAVSLVTPSVPASNYFIYLSLFLAFAYLNPNLEMYLFFILPVKIKWLAAITWAFQAAYFIMGDFASRLSVLATLGNFLLFFGGDILRRLRGTTAALAPSRSATEGSKTKASARHCCRVCGRTELSHPQLDFRYTADDSCYCTEHLPSRQTTTPSTSDTPRPSA